MIETSKDESEDYPSVALAYPIALNSYDVAERRLDVVDNRLQTLIAFGTTVSLSAIAFASAKGSSFRSVWFGSAMVALACALIVGTVGRLKGHVQLLYPSVLYQHWLHFSEWEFKKNLIYFAGEHFEANRTLAEQRSRFTTVSAILFLIDGIALAVWAVLSIP